MQKQFITFLSFTLCLFIVGCDGHHSNSETKQQTVTVNNLSFARSVAEINAETDQLLIELEHDAALIIATDSPSFETTIEPLNDLLCRYQDARRRNYLLFSAGESSELRQAATQNNDRLHDWAMTLYSNEALCLAVDTIAIPGEKEKETLLETIQAYFSLPTDTDDAIAVLQDRINDLSTQFSANLYDAVDEVIPFSPAEMEGVSEWLRSEFERDADGNYLMLSYNYNHLINITFNAVHEESRRKACAAYFSLAKDSNPALLEEILSLRTEIAHLAGYESHADRILSYRMAKTADNAISFLSELDSLIQPKALEEFAPLLQLKIEETANPDASLNYWDMSYYQTKHFRLTADSQPTPVVSPLFSIESVLNGLFDLCEQLFAVRISPQQLEENGSWHEDVRYYVVEDIDSGQPLGSFYLDLYPREGKYNNFALFSLVVGNTVEQEDQRQLPVAALLGNFNQSTAERPAYLLRDRVEALFHEFGHLMHYILYDGHYGVLNSFAVPRDFVEVPSLLLQKAASDPEVLFHSCTNNQGEGEPYSLEQMQAYVDLLNTTTAMNTRYNVGISMFDLQLHRQSSETESIDSAALGNAIMAGYYTPFPDDSAWSASFAHIVHGYDASYYTYLWSDSIAYDLLSVFDDSEEGFYDSELGRKLRDEVFAPGASRDVNESVYQFLGRDWNADAYLESFTH